MHNTKRFMFLYLITTGDVNHDHLAKVVSIMFLHFKVTIFTLEVIFWYYMYKHAVSPQNFHQL